MTESDLKVGDTIYVITRHAKELGKFSVEKIGRKYIYFACGRYAIDLSNPGVVLRKDSFGQWEDYGRYWLSMASYQKSEKESQMRKKFINCISSLGYSWSSVSIETIQTIAHLLNIDLNGTSG